MGFTAAVLKLSYTPTAGYYTSFSISYVAICNDSLVEIFGVWSNKLRNGESVADMLGLGESHIEFLVKVSVA
jgi:hypothetical protein